MNLNKCWLLVFVVTVVLNRGLQAASSPASQPNEKEDVVEYKDQGQTDATPRVNVLLRQKNQKGELIPYVAPERRLEITGVTVKYGNGFEVGTGMRLPAGTTQTSRQLQFGAKYKIKLANGAVGEFVLPAKIDSGAIEDITVVMETPKTPAVPVNNVVKGKVEGVDGDPQVEGGVRFSGWSVIYVSTDRDSRQARIQEDGSFVLINPRSGREAILLRGGDWQLYVPKLDAETPVLKKDVPGAIVATGKARTYKVKYDIGNLGKGAHTNALGLFLTSDAQLPVAWNAIKEPVGILELNVSAGEYTVRLMSQDAGGKWRMHKIDEVKLNESSEQLIELKKVEPK